mmetsp:Transcript_19541/g.41981  ORF Transcript_19541/g.41981 Transcript_19541/m.41981 type:complete len:113 (+) Transcript_19541:499-837(+)
MHQHGAARSLTCGSLPGLPPSVDEEERLVNVDMQLQNMHLVLHTSQLERRVLSLELERSALWKEKVALETEVQESWRREALVRQQLQMGSMLGADLTALGHAGAAYQQLFGL